MATRKIHFFTGKGGVGKSAVSAGFALSLAAKTSKKTLLVELAERSFYQHYLDLKSLAYSPLEYSLDSSERIEVSQWSPNSCLKEYALHLFKVESLYKLFFENPVSKSLIQIAPGLHELAILGKATSSVRKHGPKMTYDDIVIDAFATGHFLSLLRAPAAMAEIITFGPMGEQSRSIDSWIRNPDFVEIYLVTTSEDYCISETLELHRQIEKEFQIKAKIILNKTFQFNSLDKNLGKNFDFVSDICLQEKIACEKIRALDKNFIQCPLIAELKPKKILAEIRAAFINGAHPHV